MHYRPPAALAEGYQTGIGAALANSAPILTTHAACGGNG